MKLLATIYHLSQHADRLTARHTRDCGLTPRQILVLDAVARGPRTSQTLICAATGVDRSTMVMRILVREGLVVRARHPRDARTWVLQLTDKGKAAVTMARVRVRQAEVQIRATVRGLDRLEIIEPAALPQAAE